MRVCLFTAAILAACNLGMPVGWEGGLDGRVGPDVADAEGDGDESGARPGDGAPDAGDGGQADGGPITNVATVMTALVDRLCDLDGDGVGDNALADLGPAHDDLFAAAMTSLMQGGLERGARMLFHIPWVDDLSVVEDDDLVLVFFEGRDLDVPEDRSDDFSGEEEFYVRWVSVDACGEPISVFPGARLDEGQLSTPVGSVMVPCGAGETLVLRQARAAGTIAPKGASADLSICGYLTATEAGASELADLGGFNLLEAVVAAAKVLGIPTLPSLEPDVDVDGDGLEQFTVDASGALVACIDGDATVIEGRRCWADDRIADGFALSFRLESVSAESAGLEPGWVGLPPGDCDSPPDVSLWDPR